MKLTDSKQCLETSVVIFAKPIKSKKEWTDRDDCYSEAFDSQLRDWRVEDLTDSKTEDLAHRIILHLQQRSNGNKSFNIFRHIPTEEIREIIALTRGLFGQEGNITPVAKDLYKTTERAGGKSVKRPSFQSEEIKDFVTVQGLGVVW